MNRFILVWEQSAADKKTRRANLEFTVSASGGGRKENDAGAGKFNVMVVRATEKKTNQVDAELVQIVDAAAFGAEEITADNLLEKFREDAQFNFFPAFRQKEEVVKIYKDRFAASANALFAQAEKIINGEFDSSGGENSDSGAEIEQRYEPMADTPVPLKSQKQTDESAANGDVKIVRQSDNQQYFFTLGAAFWLTGDERCAECFARRLDEWMRENQSGGGINSASDLEVARRAMSWIWAFHFFKDAKQFTPEFFQQALKFVYRLGEHLMKNLSNADRSNARLTGEALGLYYLGTQFQFFKAARLWRETGAKILFEELGRQIPSNGTRLEQSTCRQRDAADFYTHFYILQTLSGEETDGDRQMKLSAKLQSLVDFLMFATRLDSTTPTTSEGDERCLPLGGGKSDDLGAALSTNAVLFERGDYKYVAGEFAEAALWLLGGAGEQSFESLGALIPDEGSAAFEAGGYYIMRDGWAKADNFLLVAGGEPDAPGGGHADALAVDVAVGDQHRFLVNLEIHARRESGESSDCFRLTEDDGAPTTDDESPSEASGKISRKTKAGAELNQWISEPRFDFFEGSRRACGRAPATHKRSILFLKNDYWIFRDFVEAPGERDYKLNFHFGGAAVPRIESAENENAWIIETPEAKSGVRLFAFGDNGEWRRKTGLISDCDGETVDAPLLQFASSGTGAQEFFTFLLPTEANADAPEVYETEITGGRAFVVNFRGFQDLLVFTDGEQIVRTEIFDTNFSFLWARVGADEVLPEEFVLIGGAHFALDGTEIINHPRELESATARRFDDKLNIQTPDGVFSVSLPQKHSAVFIAKNQT